MKFIYIVLAYLSFTSSTFADEAENILGISDSKLRQGDVHIEDIPNAIRAAIDFFM